MFAIATSDTTAIGIEDANPDAWIAFYLEFDPLKAEKLNIEYLGLILSMSVNPENAAIWAIADGLLAVSKEQQQAFRIPMPEEMAVPFAIRQIGEWYYLVGAHTYAFGFDRNVGEWQQLAGPGPKPERPPKKDDEDLDTYMKRTNPPQAQWAIDNPDLYSIFGAGGDVYFVGALGRILRLRDGAITDTWLDSGARLVRGYEEGGTPVISADRPVAALYKGTKEKGFERIFTHEERALHLTALHRGTRYIGAGLDEEYAGPALFFIDDEGELVPVETGCAREPGNLRQLISTGGVLWAIDTQGFFRLTEDGWQLTEAADI